MGAADTFGDDVFTGEVFVEDALVAVFLTGLVVFVVRVDLVLRVAIYPL